MSVHADPLNLAQFLEAVGSDDDAEDGAPGADAEEAEVAFFDEVFQVHAVEGGDKGACCDGEGRDGEFEVQEHEGIAVCVEDGFDAVGLLVMVVGNVLRVSIYISSVLRILETKFSAAWTISSATLW